jgi:uncharacterized protein YdbL (DUF1318 family)
VKRSLVLIAVLGAFVAAPAAAQPSSVSGAIAAAKVGERYDGYLGVVDAGSPQLQRQVAAVNIQRRKLYIDLGERRSVAPELVGMATACQLFSQLGVGEAYMLNDRVWRRRAAGQTVPLPDYCR